MKHALATILAAGLLSVPGLAMAQATYPAVPATPVAPTAPTTTTPVAPGTIYEGHPHGEHHPEMRKALRHLEEAKQELEHAEHDYAGHREQALKLIDQAEAQLHAGLEEDRR